jgi:preprotein translocase subunit YajC
MNRILALMLFLSTSGQSVFAMAQRPEPGAPPPPAWVQIVPFAVMLLVFYMLLIRPQMKQRKEKDNMMNNLKKGDRVVTTGGFIATIVNIGPTIVDVKINEETKAKVLKSSIIDILKEETPGAAS